MDGYPFTECLHPRRLWQKSLNEYIVVPCNHCMACRLRASSRLSDSVRFEGITSAQVFFVTLTYANRYVPAAYIRPRKPDDPLWSCEYDIFDCDTDEYIDTCNCDPQLASEFLEQAHLFGNFPYIRFKDVQDFVKRVRDRFTYGTIRYFACGEYGPDHFRPHFHLLFFVTDTSEVMRISEHPLGYFPRWTWPEKPDRVYTPADILTELEFACRDCWKFGRVDFELVGKESCTSYVADYVNGAQPVPPFLEVPATRSRCSHSRFLGRAFFRKEFIQSVFSRPEDVVSAYVPRPDGIREERLPAYHYSAFFPKCKGYACASRESRMSCYLLLDECERHYGEGYSVIDYARLVLSDLCHGVSGISFLDYFFTSSGLCDLSFDSPDDLEKCLFNIYRELLTSRRFLKNCALLYDHFLDTSWSSSLDFMDVCGYYLTVVETFWSRVDMMNLKQWYRSMENYYTAKLGSFCLDDVTDDHDDPDLVYFYNNRFYRMEDFEDSDVYRKFHVYITARARDKIKHKEQNAKNLKFLQDE